MKKFRYLPNTEQDRQDMLEVIGAKDIMDLFSDIPENVRLDEPMDLPASLSEYELLKHARELAS